MIKELNLYYSNEKDNKKCKSYLSIFDESNLLIASFDNEEADNIFKLLTVKNYNS